MSAMEPAKFTTAIQILAPKPISSPAIASFMTITAYSITVSTTTASTGVSVSYSSHAVKKLMPIRILAGVSFIPK